MPLPAKKKAFCKEELEIHVCNCILPGSDIPLSRFKHQAFEFQKCFRKKQNYSLKRENNFNYADMVKRLKYYSFHKVCHASVLS